MGTTPIAEDDAVLGPRPLLEYIKVLAENGSQATLDLRMGTNGVSDLRLLHVNDDRTSVIVSTNEGVYAATGTYVSLKFRVPPFGTPDSADLEQFIRSYKRRGQ